MCILDGVARARFKFTLTADADTDFITRSIVIVMALVVVTTTGVNGPNLEAPMMSKLACLFVCLFKEYAPALVEYLFTLERWILPYTGYMRTWNDERVVPVYT